jgi:environmental stress-induced protein Ves
VPVALLRAATYRRVAWKNGGGTTELVAVAAGATPAWRISVARIERDGPFSDFCGYDRTIVSLSGDGVTLVFSSDEERRLSLLAPYSFPGEAEVEARLAHGPVSDLNVMTLRETHRHDVAVIGIGENGVPVDAGDVCGFLYVASGAVVIDGQTVEAGDTARLDAGARTIAEATGGPATTILMRIFGERTFREDAR